MIHIIAGGKSHPREYAALIEEYRKKSKKPFDFSFSFYEPEKLDAFLSNWKFPENAFVIIADERGRELTSPELSNLLKKSFLHSREVFIIIGGAFGVSKTARNRADFLWSFGKLVFPHQLARLIVSEQLYRAHEIARGSHYHHE